MSSYLIRPGDTLGAIARRYGTSVDSLARANNIRDPNKIIAGSQLQLPGTQTLRPTSPAPLPAPRQPARDTFTASEPRRSSTANQTWTDPRNANTTYRSSNGVPLFSQGDAAWGGRRLGGAGMVSGNERSNSIQAKGCAITAAAMSMSALSGRTITPREMDQFLDANGGYSGNLVDFAKTAAITGGDPRITATRQRNLSISEIDQQLAEGRPVLIGVNYKSRKSGAPDHWITLTGRGPNGTYTANDPNGGRVITLQREGNGLMAPESGTPKGLSYHFSQHGVTFAGGRPVRPTVANGQDSYTSRPATTQTSTPSRPHATQASQRTQAPRANAATGNNAILNQLQTTGASRDTARQDRLATTGVEASRTMAETDRGRLTPYRETFQRIGATYEVPPAVLAAIASRESRGGAALRPDGNARFDPNGYGLMQIDRKENPRLIQGGPTSEQHIAVAAKLLQDNLAAVRKMHPTWSPAEQLRGAIAAYNFGTDDVRTRERLDIGSTGNDYSADVWARAQYLAAQGF